MLMKKVLHKNLTEDDLLKQPTELVENNRAQAIVQVNASITQLFWQIGFRINEFVLKNGIFF